MTNEEIDQYADEQNKKYNLPEGLIKAVIQIESNYDINALKQESNGRYSIGLMQILRGGAIDVYERLKRVTKDDNFYYEPKNNIDVGSWYLGERIPYLLNHYKHQKTLDNLIICYNAGIGNLNKGHTPISTKEYISKIKEKLGIKEEFNTFFFSCPHCSSKINIQVTA